MSCDPEKHHRRSIRLKGYDHAQPGAYFVTVVTQDRTCLFGDVVDGETRLNDAGCMVVAEWEALPDRFPGVDLDAFIVMPNHIHGIIVVTEGAGLVPALDGATTRVAPTLGDVVGAFKSRVTVEYIRGVKAAMWSAFRSRLWQRNYYEHVIRDEESLSRIRRYIVDNPMRWEYDRENPLALAPEARNVWAQ